MMQSKTSARTVSLAVMLIVGCSSRQPRPSASADKLDDCRGMKDLSSIPPGFHPTSARWEPGSTFGDTVCIAKTAGKEIQVLAWHGFALPAGYYTVASVTTGVNTSFRGCAQWSEWQGHMDCMASWSVFTMRKNP